METSGQLHALATLLPAKNSRYPFDRRLGGSEAVLKLWRREQIISPTGNRTQVIQLIPNRYTD
jgi:hypothetical protein